MTFIESIENKLSDILVFTQEEKDYLTTHLELIELKKGDFLIKQGDPETHLYMVESGIIRYWTYNAKEEERTFWFSFPGDISFSALSLHLNIPCTFNAQALEDCVLSRISYEALYKLFSDSTHLLTPVVIITLTNVEEILQRAIDILKMKPHELYEKMLQDKKEYIQHIPLKYLAAYLGITPQALSRIRKKIN